MLKESRPFPPGANKLFVSRLRLVRLALTKILQRPPFGREQRSLKNAWHIAHYDGQRPSDDLSPVLRLIVPAHHFEQIAIIVGPGDGLRLRGKRFRSAEAISLPEREAGSRENKIQSD